MPSRKAVRAEDKRLATPGKKKKKAPGKNNQVDAPKTKNQALRQGDLSMVELMDDEELAKGCFKQPDGKWPPGRKPPIPGNVHAAIMAKINERANETFNEALHGSIEALKQIRDNPRLPADARYKASVYLIERSIGKVPEKTEMKVELSPWEKAVGAILVDDGEDEDD